MVQDLEMGPTTSVSAFGDRLAEAVERKRSQLIVGLDPVTELLPVELAGEAGLGRSEAAKAYARFCCGVIDAVAAYAVGVWRGCVAERSFGAVRPNISDWPDRSG